jgi:uncharacterized alpha/beta hydrolase family protein
MDAITTVTKCKPTARGFRIWLEGSKLAAAGFTWKLRYTRTAIAGQITLKVDPNGKLKVAGRMRKGNEMSIIDISLAQLEGFKPDQVVTATFTSNTIVIK